MDFTEVMSALKDASLYDLFRLDMAIQNELDNPERIRIAKNSFSVGDTVSFFNAGSNALIPVVVLEKKPKSVNVRVVETGQLWKISYCSINLSGKESGIRQTHQKEKLTKNHVKVGDWVGFDYEGKQHVGVIDKLNYKTASLITRDNKRWRVSYGMLFKVIDGEINFSTSEIAGGVLISYDKELDH